MTSPRERLAADQAALLRSLVAGGPPPPGFDRERIEVEAKALLAKRRRVTALLAPDLPGALGDDFGPLFDEYARAHPRTVETRSRADVDMFREWLTARGHLAGERSPRRRWPWRRA